MSKDDVSGFPSFPVVTGLLLMMWLLAASIMAGDNGRNIETLKKSVPDPARLENKIVYLDFWASWCMPCRKSFPWMESIQNKYADSGLVFITVNVDKDPDAAKRFLEENHLNALSLFDPKGELAEIFELKVMPTSFIFNRNGELELVHEGFSEKEKDQFEQKLVALLHGKKLTDE